MSQLEEKLAFQLKAAGLDGYQREHVFAPPRKWRIDFAWPDHRLAVEVEGGIYNGGRHTRPIGFIGDIEKYNRAAMDGWLLLRVTGCMIRSGEALRLVEAALTKRRPLVGPGAWKA